MTDGPIHELVTLTRRLDSNEIKRLRTRLTSAKISTTRLSISGDPDMLAIDLLDLLGAHFDVMISSRPDGFRRLALRLPPSMREPELRRFSTRSLVETTRTGGAWLLDIQAPPLAFMAAIDPRDEEADHDPGWLDALAPLHTAVSSGDLRPLYVAWLHGAILELGGDEREPEVPAGLKAPSRALEALTEYLRVDPKVSFVCSKKQRSYAARAVGANAMAPDAADRREGRSLAAIRRGRHGVGVEDRASISRRERVAFDDRANEHACIGRGRGRGRARDTFTRVGCVGIENGPRASRTTSYRHERSLNEMPRHGETG